jgi:hypothetical protein
MKKMFQTEVVAVNEMRMLRSLMLYILSFSAECNVQSTKRNFRLEIHIAEEEKAFPYFK